MRVLVVGAGSVGGYFGARLAEAGRDVTFLVRPGRAAQLQERGLEIVSPHGDTTLHPRIATADAIDGPYDVVILAVKAVALDAAVADFAPVVGASTMILPVLNGMRHLDVLTGRFGPQAVLGGVCKVATTLDADGRIVQISPLQELAYGELDGSMSERVRRLDDTLQGAGFAARLSEHIAREMWEKWVLLASLGAATCLMRGSIGEVMAAPGGRAFIDGVITEVVAAISAAGIAPSPDFLAAARTQLTAVGSPMTSSMYRDLKDGRPIEADQIIGDLIARAGTRGVSTPLLATAYTNLCVYARRLGT